MGVFDKIAGVFVEKTDSPQEEKPVMDTKKSIMTTPNVLGTLGNLTAAPAANNIQASAADLSKFVQHFDDLFNSANLPGPDYYEFIKMSEAMGALGDEIKFPAVFNALKVQGLTKAGLLNSAQEYIKIIDNDAVQFNAAIDQKVVAEIEANKAKVENLRNMIKNKTDMILALQKEIEQHTQEIQVVSTAIQDDESKLSIKINSYRTACESKKMAITTDIQKINSLIK
jgi:hypothetical protein